MGSKVKVRPDRRDREHVIASASGNPFVPVVIKYSLNILVIIVFRKNTFLENV